MAVSQDDKPAFRCRECGHLEDVGHAGENAVPYACSVCGAGVKFHPRTGMKVADPSNWVVLADLDEPTLKGYGLTPEEVGKRPEGGAPVAQNALIVGRNIQVGLTG